MARADYYAIAAGMAELLRATASLSGVRIEVEREMQFGVEVSPWVGIYLQRRDAPRELQTLAAGQQTRFLVRLALWCAAYSPESVAKASELRDDLVGKVEVALLADRTFQGTVATSWLEGGELPSAREGEGWLSRGEIVVVADVKATT